MTAKLTTEDIHVVAVDDNAADRLLLRQAFQSRAPFVTLHHFSGGQEALDFLRQAAMGATAHPIHACIVDNEMPGMSGMEMLRVIKADDALKSIPVIMLSGAALENDVSAAYKEQVSAFVRKPFDTAQLHRVIELLALFWRDFVVFDSEAGANG